MKKYDSYYLVKYDDLNHHGTLFAAKTAYLFVATGFGAAAMAVNDPDKIVLIKLHGMTFTKPIEKGDVILCSGQVVKVGKTSLTTYISISSMHGYTPVEGYATYVTVDKDGNKIPHGLVLDETTDELELKHRQEALNLK